MDKTALSFKVLSGQASVEEQAALDRWINESKANEAEFNDLRLLWNSNEHAPIERADHFYEGLYQNPDEVQTKVASAEPE